MIEEEITIKVKADTSDFKKGMEDAAKATEKLEGKGGKTSMDDVSKATEDVKDKFKKIGAESDKVKGQTANSFKGMDASAKITGATISASILSKLGDITSKIPGLAAVGVAIGAIGKTASETGGSFKDMFKNLKGVFEKMGASSKLATAGAVGVAIAAVGIIGYLVAKISKKIMEVSGQMTKLYDPAGYEKATNDMNKSLLKMKTTLGAVLEPFYKLMTAIVGGLADAFNGVLETILRIYAAFVGFIGLSGTLSRDAEDYSESMEEATASADAGLASFDKLNTLNTDTGDAAQAEYIRNMMADTAIAADAFRNSLVDALNPIKAMEKLLRSMGLGDVWDDFAKAAGNAWTNIVSFGEDAWAQIVDVATDFWNGVTDTARKIWNAFVNVASKIGNVFINAFKTVAAPIISIFTSAWTAIFTLFTDGIDGAVQALVNGFDAAFRSVREFGEKTWAALVDLGKTLFGGLGDTMRDIFNNVFGNISFDNFLDGFIGGLKNGLNGIIAAWNNTVANLGFEIDLPDWMGGGKWGVNTYGWKIPLLAQGTVADPNDPFLAIIGDNPSEREVVSPVSTIEQAVRNVLGEGGQAQKIELTVNLDGRKIARGIYDYLDTEARRRGQAWH